MLCLCTAKDLFILLIQPATPILKLKYDIATFKDLDPWMCKVLMFSCSEVPRLTDVCLFLFFSQELSDLEPNVFLRPFLEVVRSEDTTGPITGLALTSVNKFLSFGLIGETSWHWSSSMLHPCVHTLQTVSTTCSAGVNTEVQHLPCVCPHHWKS